MFVFGLLHSKFKVAQGPEYKRERKEKEKGKENEMAGLPKWVQSQSKDSYLSESVLVLLTNVTNFVTAAVNIQFYSTPNE